MTIVVQNCVTNEYLDDAGRWTSELASAKIFNSTLAAYDHCRAFNIPDSQVLLHFGRHDLDLAVPVSANCRH